MPVKALHLRSASPLCSCTLRPGRRTTSHLQPCLMDASARPRALAASSARDRPPSVFSTRQGAPRGAGTAHLRLRGDRPGGSWAAVLRTSILPAHFGVSHVWDITPAYCTPPLQGEHLNGSPQSAALLPEPFHFILSLSPQGFELGQLGVRCRGDQGTPGCRLTLF